MITLKKIDPMKIDLNFLLAGVGGQGAILASSVIAEVGLGLNLDAKQAEVHGMSQRGGSVISQVRWAPKVHSPILAKGDADFLLAFEKLEALRYIDYLKPNGVALINAHQILPITVSAGDSIYPDDTTIMAAVDRFTSNSHWLSALEIAEKIGNARVTNVVLLGALSAFIAINPQIWLDAIGKRVPSRHLDLNQRAFFEGRNALDR
jgi:indolepyruvate ferredoxin oxidoreductase beta subunit